MPLPPRHTEETWFLHFSHERGQTHSHARIQTTDGSLITDLAPVEANRKTDYSRETAKRWKDNVRVMAAGQRMQKALGPLIEAALKAGLSADHPSIKEAQVALMMATPPLHVVTHAGEKKFEGTGDECFERVMRLQGQSVDYALKYGDWAIVPKAEYDAKANIAAQARRETHADSFDISRVTDEDFEYAAGLDDIHQAALSLQNIAGIESGDIAALLLDETEWLILDKIERREKLETWIRSEPNFRP